MMRIQFLTLLGLCSLLSAAVDVRLEADTRILSRNEPALLQGIVVTDQEVTKLPPLPEGEGYSATVRKESAGQSTSMRSINGRRTVQREHRTVLSYEVTFQGPGTYTIEADTVTAEGVQYAFPRQKFTVTEERRRPPVSVQFLRDEDTLFAGEQSSLTLRILRRSDREVQISTRGIRELLTEVTEGMESSFTTSVLLGDTRLEEKTVTENGQRYGAIDIPLRVTTADTGDFRFGPFTFSYTERKRARGSGGFAGYSSYRNVRRSYRTPVLTYTVSGLPPAPAGFTGAMRRIDLSASFAQPRTSGDTLNAGEELSLTIGMKGFVSSGALRGIGIDSVPGATLFAPEESLSVDTINGRIHTKKELTYIILPRREGTVTIPPVECVWFDTDAETYRRVRSGDSVTFHVRPGAQDPAAFGRGQISGEIARTGEDVQYIREKPGPKAELFAWRNTIYRRMVYLPWLLSAGLIILKLLQSLGLGGLLQRIHPTPRQRALRAVRDIRGGDSSISPAAVLEDFLSGRLNIPAASLTVSQLDEAFKERGVSSETLTKIGELRAAIEMQQYARSGTDIQSTAKSLEECIRAVDREADHG
ncbi:MAG: BatD family protein [Fibrobacterota bacterium]